MSQFDLDRIRAQAGIAALEYFESLGSTNDLGLERIRAAARSNISDSFPRLILTETQTAGRGQHQRKWESDAGNLTCSLCLAVGHQSRQSLIPLAVGLAVCEAIESLAPAFQLGLKWPNDIFWAKRKVGGVLIEGQASITSTQWSGVVIGIGLNVNQPVSLTHDISSPSNEWVSEGSEQRKPFQPISLIEILGQAVDLTELTIAVVQRVLFRLSHLESGANEVLERCEERLVFRGRELNMNLPDGRSIQGRYIGLGSAGELQLDSHGQRLILASGTVTGW